jgi:XRE family transcriptional regulator, regulator of sulfur utilization
MTQPIAANLASNVRKLREARGLTQQQIAKLAGVPRPTWANLESGQANPTIAVLVRAADALQVRIEELIGAPKAAGKLYGVDTLPVRRRGNVVIRKLLPESLPGLEIERMELPAGGHMVGIPHTQGTREYLTCEHGAVELTVSGKTWRLGPGDVAVFRGDQRHSYRNPGRATAAAYSVVAFAPTAAP